MDISDGHRSRLHDHSGVLLETRVPVAPPAAFVVGDEDLVGAWRLAVTEFTTATESTVVLQRPVGSEASLHSRTFATCDDLTVSDGREDDLLLDIEGPTMVAQRTNRTANTRSVARALPQVGEVEHRALDRSRHGLGVAGHEFRDDVAEANATDRLDATGLSGAEVGQNTNLEQATSAVGWRENTDLLRDNASRVGAGPELVDLRRSLDAALWIEVCVRHGGTPGCCLSRSIVALPNHEIRSRRPTPPWCHRRTGEPSPRRSADR